MSDSQGPPLVQWLERAPYKGVIRVRFPAGGFPPDINSGAADDHVTLPTS
jgi:hypothetical protein